MTSSRPISDGSAVVVRLLYTPHEAAEALSIGLTKMYELLATGAVRSIKIGTARRIAPTALADYIETQAQP